MASFWLEWSTGEKGSIEANDATHALDLGELATGTRPTCARPIHYLALPVLPGLPNPWPPYCRQPDECAGKNYCAGSPSCDS